MGSARESYKELPQAALLFELDSLGNVAPVYRFAIRYTRDGNQRTGKVRTHPPDKSRWDCLDALPRPAIQGLPFGNRNGHFHVASIVLYKCLQSTHEWPQCLQGYGNIIGFRKTYNCQRCSALSDGNCFEEWNNGGPQSLLQQCNSERHKSHHFHQVALVTKYHRTLFGLRGYDCIDHGIHML